MGIRIKTIILLLLLSFIITGCTTKPLQTTGDGTGLTIQYLDENGNIVKTVELSDIETQAVFKGRYAIDKSYAGAIFKLDLQNTGNLPINISVNEARFKGVFVTK